MLVSLRPDSRAESFRHSIAARRGRHLACRRHGVSADLTAFRFSCPALASSGPPGLDPAGWQDPVQLLYLGSDARLAFGPFNSRVRPTRPGGRSRQCPGCRGSLVTGAGL